MIKVAINGFGRIGRLAFREIMKSKKLEVVAINDLSAPSMLAYLLKYDSIQGTFNANVSHTENALVVDNKSIAVYAERNPQDLPWAKHQVDLVLECTGIFESKEKASAHFTAGARKVIISAPSDKDVKTVVYNVNHDILQSNDQLISCASCTTNCLAPMAKVLNDNFGIVTGQMTTIHAYTNSQPLMDTPDPKVNYRKSRAAANNIVPYTTGAAKAIGLVIPELKGKLDGSSQRVPVQSGSVVELFTILEKTVSAEEINKTMKAAANESYGYTEDPIVSSDVIGIGFGSLFDATQTKVIAAGEKQLVKTVAWYDNEMSFVSQMVRTAEYFGAL
ncbi:MAG: type I glyceraldehyde-3-phosphate dehydrogenase [Bacteroidetes bacterium GWF2_42_66]|nr:MAG: type I glyceraldehyde-3-phosphate dehydrogenase [Bacteroidetes bacterium GWE2_42_39]OFY44463.1 MAG: type I glyceraldehyde-3-phosphate dehydrogenase [Bacteroidetes bacterium GWF2_42_66]HBL74993.1 type I glyceraldehyde-3-phosphate dehydrogenase [Prolixibacteraceae bacterium]HCU62258.1 type I glyceraldehyde-3-phosphate dehydrogenase [Prolixibacteraceae bacterium]